MPFATKFIYFIVQCSYGLQSLIDGSSEPLRNVDGLYGPERVVRTLGSSAAATAELVADALLTDVATFQGGRLRDDVAILVVQAGS